MMSLFFSLKKFVFDQLQNVNLFGFGHPTSTKILPNLNANGIFKWNVKFWVQVAFAIFRLFISNKMHRTLVFAVRSLIRIFRWNQQNVAFF